MSVALVDSGREGAEEVIGPEVPLCLSCWTPQGPRADFCSACGAPVSTMATVGPIETIWAWAWALGAAGRWKWTRVVSLLAVWPYVAAEVVAFLFLFELPLDGPRSWTNGPVLAVWLVWLTVQALVLRYVTLRWWRLRGAPAPSAPDDIQPDAA